MHDRLRHTAEQQAIDTCPPVRGEDRQCRAMLLGDRTDDLGGFTQAHERLHRGSRLCQTRHERRQVLTGLTLGRRTILRVMANLTKTGSRLPTRRRRG